MLRLRFVDPSSTSDSRTCCDHDRAGGRRGGIYPTQKSLRSAARNAAGNAVELITSWRCLSPSFSLRGLPTSRGTKLTCGRSSRVFDAGLLAGTRRCHLLGAVDRARGRLRRLADTVDVPPLNVPSVAPLCRITNASGTAVVPPPREIFAKFALCTQRTVRYWRSFRDLRSGAVRTGLTGNVHIFDYYRHALRTIGGRVSALRSAADQPPLPNAVGSHFDPVGHLLRTPLHAGLIGARRWDAKHAADPIIRRLSAARADSKPASPI